MRRGGEEPVELHPLGGKPVEVGRAHVRIAVATEERITMVIRKNEKNVGLGRRRRGSPGETQKTGRQKLKNRFHRAIQFMPSPFAPIMPEGVARRNWMRTEVASGDELRKFHCSRRLGGKGWLPKLAPAAGMARSEILTNVEIDCRREIGTSGQSHHGPEAGFGYSYMRRP